VLSLSTANSFNNCNLHMGTLSMEQAISSPVSIEVISISSILCCSTTSTQLRRTCQSVANLQVYEETAVFSQTTYTQAQSIRAVCEHHNRLLRDPELEKCRPAYLCKVSCHQPAMTNGQLSVCELVTQHVLITSYMAA